uniref:ALOG domain-containing protein n=1 Tax=Oryza sativa subsp. japonica TaxID=39947 RepID=Q6Z070_ORYSJ|nr:hypothetical protein [Oryza sativa Japonica Group]BAD03686.1 hypothetical protein [Oryza sativa Japonica Group]
MDKMARTAAGGVERGSGSGGRVRSRRSHPSPLAPCPCPLRQAWGSLDVLVGHLRAAFEEHGGHPEANPFSARAVRLYLHERAQPLARRRRRRDQPTWELASQSLSPWGARHSRQSPAAAAPIKRSLASAAPITRSLAAASCCLPRARSAPLAVAYRALARRRCHSARPTLPLRLSRARPPPPPPRYTPPPAILAISAAVDATPCEHALREKRERGEERYRR